MKHALRILFRIQFVLLAAFGLTVQAQIITSVDRQNGDPRTPGVPMIVPGPSPVGLQDGSRAFMDRWLNDPRGPMRMYWWENIPSELLGADYVLTFNDDKFGGARNVTYSVTLSQAATLSVFLDHRYQPFPWLSNGSAGAVFTDSGSDIDLNEFGGEGVLRPFHVYTAEVNAGTYVLGPSFDGSGSRNFYGIAAVRLKVEIKPETLNMSARGGFSALVELPDGYSANDVTGVDCAGAPALSFATHDDRGLFALFDRENLVGVTPGDAVELVVAVTMTDGTRFIGGDQVRVVVSARKP